ncbi:MAG: threonine dehydrogenase-like Zn-dependent dehydrogenase, partial [Saprospiraceae bacterium]
DMPASKAALTEPGATGLHAVLLAERSLSRPISEATTLVIGGGSVGLLTALLLADKGVVDVKIAETNALRRATIEKHTDIEVFDPISHPAEEDGFDIVFDAVGGEHTRNSSIKSIKPGGTVVHIGLMDNAGTIDIRYITLQEIIFIGCYTYSPVDIQKTLNKLYSGALGNLNWVDERALEDGAEAFSDLLAGRSSAPKIVLSA